MTAISICSDLEPRKIKSDTISTVPLSISHEVMGPDATILVFWMWSFKPTFSLSSFTFIMLKPLGQTRLEDKLGPASFLENEGATWRGEPRGSHHHRWSHSKPVTSYRCQSQDPHRQLLTGNSHPGQPERQGQGLNKWVLHEASKFCDAVTHTENLCIIFHLYPYENKHLHTGGKKCNRSGRLSCSIKTVMFWFRHDHGNF